MSSARPGFLLQQNHTFYRLRVEAPSKEVLWVGSPLEYHFNSHSSSGRLRRSCAYRPDDCKGSTDELRHSSHPEFAGFVLSFERRNSKQPCASVRRLVAMLADSGRRSPNEASERTLFLSRATLSRNGPKRLVMHVLVKGPGGVPMHPFLGLGVISSAFRLPEGVLQEKARL